jgi:hypothetical protein
MRKAEEWILESKTEGQLSQLLGCWPFPQNAYQQRIKPVKSKRMYLDLQATQKESKKHIISQELAWRRRF